MWETAVALLTRQRPSARRIGECGRADVVVGTAGLSALVTHRVAVSDIDRAFRLAADYRIGAVKVAVRFGPPTSRG
jgi:hypothetical protein